MTDSTRAAIQPASSVAAPALRKRFFEAHRFLSRVAQFPLVLAKLYRDGLDHPQFFAALSELLPLERLCFCLWEPHEMPGELQQVELWSWEAKRPPAAGFCDIETSLLQSLRSKPLRINECHSEIEEEQLLMGMPLWGEETRSMLVLPMHYDNQFIGLLLMCAHQAARYNDGDFAHGQFIADALAPMAAYRKLAQARSEAEQVTLANLAQERATAAEELDELRDQLALAERARLDAEARASSLEAAHASHQKRLDASKQERQRLNDQIQRYRDEREMLRQTCDLLHHEAHRAIEDGEELRQVLLRTHRSVSMFRQIAEQRIKDGIAASQSQTELILDASSQMIPEALNSLNHLSSLQDPSFGQLNSRQQRFVRFSLRSVRYISQLLSELNDYNRCMLGQLKLNPESLQLDPIFEEVKAKFHSHAKQKRIKVRWARDGKVGMVLGDAYVTRQMLYTLLEHAVDATPISGIIDFQVAPAHDNPDMYSLVLEHDSEIELLRDGQLEDLFVPFQRPDFDPDDDIPPGLSLALARELAVLHQGHIDVEQVEERLRFTIQLPLVLEPSEKPRSAVEVYTPMMELSPLDEAWEVPFAQHYQIPQLPHFATSSDQFSSPSLTPPPLSRSSASLTPPPLSQSSASLTPPPLSRSSASLPPPPNSRSSASLPQPPRSLSSPSLPTFPPLAENSVPMARAAIGEADAFLDAASGPSGGVLPSPMSSPSLRPLPSYDSGEFHSELFVDEPDFLDVDEPDFLMEDSAEDVGTPAPPSRPSVPGMVPPPLDDDGAATMLSPSMLSAPLTPPPLPTHSAMKPSPSSPLLEPPDYGEISDDDLEAELELEENAPTQLFRVGPQAAPSTASSVVFEVDALDGEDSFILEEIEDVDLAHDVEDEFVIEELDDEPEFLTPSGIRRSTEGALVYLSSEPGSPPPSLFSLIDAWGVPLIEKESASQLTSSLSHPAPGAVALISTSPIHDHATLLVQLQRSLSAKRLPLMNIQQFPEREARIQLHFAEHQSEYLKESFWLGWLDRIRHPHTDQPRQVLSIGLGSLQEEPSALLTFCCGNDYDLYQEDNPALGVQRLYQSPPDLMLIQLDEPTDHWSPLLQEVGRSARTRDVPILFFSQNPPSETLEYVLKPLHFLMMLAR